MGNVCLLAVKTIGCHRSFSSSCRSSQFSTNNVRLRVLVSVYLFSHSRLLSQLTPWILQVNWLSCLFFLDQHDEFGERLSGGGEIVFSSWNILDDDLDPANVRQRFGGQERILYLFEANLSVDLGLDIDWFGGGRSLLLQRISIELIERFPVGAQYHLVLFRSSLECSIMPSNKMITVSQDITKEWMPKKRMKSEQNLVSMYSLSWNHQRTRICDFLTTAVVICLKLLVLSSQYHQKYRFL